MVEAVEEETGRISGVDVVLTVEDTDSFVDVIAGVVVVDSLLDVLNDAVKVDSPLPLPLPLPPVVGVIAKVDVDVSTLPPPLPVDVVLRDPTTRKGSSTIPRVGFKSPRPLSRMRRSK